MKNKTTFYISMKVILICAAMIVMILICAAMIVMIAIQQWYLLFGFLVGLASSIKEKNINEK